MSNPRVSKSPSAVRQVSVATTSTDDVPQTASEERSIVDAMLQRDEAEEAYMATVDVREVCADILEGMPEEEQCLHYDSLRRFVRALFKVAYFNKTAPPEPMHFLKCLEDEYARQLQSIQTHIFLLQRAARQRERDQLLQERLNACTGLPDKGIEVPTTFYRVKMTAIRRKRMSPTDLDHLKQENETKEKSEEHDPDTCATCNTRAHA